MGSALLLAGTVAKTAGSTYINVCPSIANGPADVAIAIPNSLPINGHADQVVEHGPSIDDLANDQPIAVPGLVRLCGEQKLEAALLLNTNEAAAIVGEGIRLCVARGGDRDGLSCGHAWGGVEGVVLAYAAQLDCAGGGVYLGGGGVTVADGAAAAVG